MRKGVRFGMQDKGSWCHWGLSRVLDECADAQYSGKYSALIERYGFIIRADGQFGTFGPPGAQRPEYRAKAAFLGVDIVLEEKLVVGPIVPLAERILRDMTTGWHLMLERCKKRKVPIDVEAIWADHERFLACVRSKVSG